MDTGVLILIIALVVITLVVAGYFFYKYYLEKPANIVDHVSGNAMAPEPSSSMAGHLMSKMSKAKKHSTKAVKKMNQARQHLDKAQAHAATA